MEKPHAPSDPNAAGRRREPGLFDEDLPAAGVSPRARGPGTSSAIHVGMSEPHRTRDRERGRSRFGGARALPAEHAAPAAPPSDASCVDLRLYVDDVTAAVVMLGMHREDLVA